MITVHGNKSHLSFIYIVGTGQTVFRSAVWRKPERFVIRVKTNVGKY